MIILNNEITIFNDRGTFREDKSIYTEGFAVKRKDGRRYHADVIYLVSVSVHAWQTGNARWPDDRACHFQVVDHKMIRDIILTGPDGMQSNEGHSEIALDGTGSKTDYDKTNCNACMTDSDKHLQFLRSFFGSYESRRKDIEDDLPRVRRILELIGSVDPELEYLTSHA